MFYHDNPERKLIDAEDDAEEEARRKQETEEAAELWKRIRSALSDRQAIIVQLRAEGRTFRDIAHALDCSERTIYKDWKTIRKIAWRCLAETE